MPEERAGALRDYLEGRTDDMVELLMELASIESPTDVPESQHRIQARLGDELGRLGFRVRRIPGKDTGGHLFAEPAERTKGRPAQLLIGHSDTVWPIGTLASMPVALEDGHVTGPGTFDMKAGLVVGLFALRALEEAGLEPPATPVWFVNSDEETGSPESHRWVRLLARHVARCYVLEPAYGPEGRLKTARKGVVRYTIRVAGRPAHAGLDPTAGASAIGELGSLIGRLHAMTDLDRGITVNVGVVAGGTRPNVIAAEASAEVDVRVLTLADRDEIAQRIHALRAETPGTSISVKERIGIVPMERTARNRALWSQAVEAGRRLGLDLDEFTSGGGSDGNTTSQHTATLDGLGALGDGAHADHERVLVAGLPERAALLAELLMAPLQE